MAQEMNPTALPSVALQDDLDGGFEALVGVRNYQVIPVETTFGQRGEQIHLKRFGFTVPNIAAEYFKMFVTTAPPTDLTPNL